ncbi:MAG: hypothetical protein IJG31_04670 [Fusobacterium sp.]|nr:hypothetical protein [Fusobacterium sp.]
MTDILIYFCIIIFAAILARKNIFPKLILNKISILQTLALYILLGAMGLKIGANKELMTNLHILGFKSFVIAVFAIIFSIIFVNLFYRGDRK